MRENDTIPASRAALVGTQWLVLTFGLLLAIMIGAFLAPSRAAAQIDVYGYVASDVDFTPSMGPAAGGGIRERYIVSELVVGYRHIDEDADTQPFVFRAIVVECNNSRAIPTILLGYPAWQVTYFRTHGAATNFFYDNNDISGSHIRKIIDDGVYKDSEYGPLDVITIDPGTAVKFRQFEINCFPTFDDSQPSSIRLHFFDGLGSMREVLASGWVELPNIKSLPDSHSDKGPLFKFMANGPTNAN